MWNVGKLSDRRIVAQVLAGQRDRFGVLVERYLPAAHATAYAYTRNQQDAEDIVQEAFLKAYRSLAGLREPEKVGGWLCTIVRNLALTAAAKRQREQAGQHVLTEVESEAVPPEVEARERKELVRRHIEKLAPDAAEVLLLHYYAGHSTGEIAAIQGISRPAAKKRLERARKALGQRLLTSLAPDGNEKASRQERAQRIMGLVAGAPLFKLEVARLPPAGTVRMPGTGSWAAGAFVGVAVFAALLVLGGRGLVGRDSPGDKGAEAALLNTPAVSEAVPESPAANEGELDAPESEREGFGETGSAKVLLASTDADSDVALAWNGVIRGQVVVEETGKPIPDVELLLDYDDALPGQERPAGPIGTETTVTDEEGRFVFTGLPPGVYGLRTGQLREYTSYGKVVRDEALEEGGQLEWRVALAQKVAIRGTVVDEAGKPMPQVTVSAMTNQENVWRQGNSDENGTFAVYGFGAGGTGFTVKAKKRGYAMADREGLTVPPDGLNDMELVMAPEAVVTGLVVDGSGEPAAGAGVSFQSIRPRLSDALYYEAGEDGTFEAHALHPGAYAVGTRNPESRVWSSRGEKLPLDIAKGERIEGLVLTLEQPTGLAIEGEVRNASGDYQDVLVSVDLRLERLKEDYTFRIDGLEPGRHDVRISESNPPRRSKFIRGVEAGTAGLLVEFEPVARIEGRVVDGERGSPVMAFELAYDNGEQTEMTGHHMWQLRPQDAEGGYFMVDNVAPGTAALFVRATGYAPAMAHVRDIPPGETVDGVVVALERGITLAGLVVDDGGQPVSGATVFHGPLPEQQMLTHAAWATTDGDGAFSFQVYPEDEHTVSAYHPKHASAEVTVAVRGASRSDIRIRLSGGGTVTGRAAMPEVSLWGKTVLMFEEGVLRYRSTVGEDSTFTIEQVAPGAYTVNLGLERFDSAEQAWFSLTAPVEVKEGETSVVDMIGALGDSAVRGVLSGGDEGGAYFVQLRVIGLDGNSLEVRTRRIDDGTFYVDNMPAGALRAEVERYAEGEGIPETWAFDLPALGAGEVQDVVLPLE